MVFSAPPDIWGSNNTLVIGTSSSVEVIGMQNSDATFYGDIYAKDSKYCSKSKNCSVIRYK